MRTWRFMGYREMLLSIILLEGCIPGSENRDGQVRTGHVQGTLQKYFDGGLTKGYLVSSRKLG